MAKTQTRADGSSAPGSRISNDEDKVAPFTSFHQTPTDRLPSLPAAAAVMVSGPPRQVLGPAAADAVLNGMKLSNHLKWNARRYRATLKSLEHGAGAEFWRPHPRACEVTQAASHREVAGRPQAGGKAGSLDVVTSELPQAPFPLLSPNSLVPNHISPARARTGCKGSMWTQATEQHVCLPCIS